MSLTLTSQMNRWEVDCNFFGSEVTAGGSKNEQM